MDNNYRILKVWRNQSTNQKAKFAHIRKFDMSIPYYYSRVTGNLLFVKGGGYSQEGKVNK